MSRRTVRWHHVLIRLDELTDRLARVMANADEWGYRVCLVSDA